MAVDVQRFIDVSPWLQLIWSMPLQMILSLLFLYRILGWSAFVGFALTLILVPFNFALTRKQKTYQIEQMKSKDDRIKLMSEILNGIKVIKLYAWEPPFELKIAEIRSKELKVLRQASVLTAWNAFTLYCSPFLVKFINFLELLFP
uniref:ABC transmembrane type-1 domain-containing protein n=1 Tax=Romanomermis culicivorax TaxID=13658 RepID=A0A915JXB5_ROMCU